MLGTSAMGVLHTKVVNNEGKRGAVGVVAKNTSGVGLVVAMLSEMSNELALGEEACVWEPIHSLINLEEDGTIVDVLSHVMFIKGGLGEKFKRNREEFWFIHFGTEVVIGDV